MPRSWPSGRGRPWQRAGDLSQEIDLPIGRVPKSFVVSQQITEVAVHSWDLATATGQQASFPPAACDAALAWARTALLPEFRGDEASGMTFGPEVSVPGDAPAEDRLAGFFGPLPRTGALAQMPASNPARHGHVHKPALFRFPEPGRLPSDWTPVLTAPWPRSVVASRLPPPVGRTLDELGAARRRLTAGPTARMITGSNCLIRRPARRRKGASR